MEADDRNERISGGDWEVQLMLPFMPARFGSLAALSPQPAGSAVTWNPSDKTSNLTLSNGNLTAVSANGAICGVRSTTSHTTGKFYWEVSIDIDDGSVSGYAIGVAALTGSSSLTAADAGNDIYFNTSGAVFILGSNTFNFPNSISGVGHVIQLAIDVDNRLMWVKGNISTTWNGSGASNDPATGIGGQSLPATGAIFAGVYIQAAAASAQITVNFGATSYANSPPSGYGNW